MPGRGGETCASGVVYGHACCGSSRLGHSRDVARGGSSLLDSQESPHTSAYPCGRVGPCAMVMHRCGCDCVYRHVYKMYMYIVVCAMRCGCEYMCTVCVAGVSMCKCGCAYVYVAMCMYKQIEEVASAASSSCRHSRTICSFLPLFRQAAAFSMWSRSPPPVGAHCYERVKPGLQWVAPHPQEGLEV